ncbi:MAG TPA: tetratricopeptide repeat protein [Acidobacteriota bacterium]|nr:tetratricopeptide repeat protein [Acidobacteriota bacterium]
MIDIKEKITKAHPYLERANSLFDQARYDKALAEISKATALAPEVWLYHFAEGNILLKMGRLEDARKAALNALKLKAADSDSWLLLGVIEKALGNFRASAKAYSKSAELHEDPSVLTMLASVQATFDLGAAKQSAQRAVELDPDWDEAYKALKEINRRITEGQPT